MQVENNHIKFAQNVIRMGVRTVVLWVTVPMIFAGLFCLVIGLLFAYGLYVSPDSVTVLTEGDSAEDSWLVVGFLIAFGGLFTIIPAIILNVIWKASSKFAKLPGTIITPSETPQPGADDTKNNSGVTWT